MNAMKPIRDAVQELMADPAGSEINGPRPTGWCRVWKDADGKIWSHFRSTKRPAQISYPSLEYDPADNAMTEEEFAEWKQQTGG